MIVPSPQFLAFAAVAALVFNLSRAAWWQQGVMLLVNFAFLASFATDLAAFTPLVGFLAAGFIAHRLIRVRAATGLFIVLVVLTLLGFFWLKRYSFIPNAAFLPFPYVLVGLSYVFFRVLHVIIDSHQGAIPDRIGLVSYLNYTLNFTSLTSGPIQPYQDYHRMETEPMPIGPIAIGGALERIVVGYFKVAVVSTLLALVQHQEIDATGGLATMGAKIESVALIVVIYPIYLYINFSGYTDVVIGVARFFGIVLPENFDRPFAAENFINFWGRWHITLSGWLKTYVYNPLMIAGLQRVTAPRLAPYLAVFAFFVTFFLVGVWHGRTSEFVFFGILQGGGVAVNKLYQIVMQGRLGRRGYRELCANRLYQAGARGLTFLWFAFTLLWFWSNWGQISQFAALLGPLGILMAVLLVFIAATISLATLGAIRAAILGVTWQDAPAIRSRYVRTAWDTTLALVTLVLIVVMDTPAPDIVYKTF